ncbi:hypothetical protein EJK52_0023 [Moraxella catarrhalis]|nr:hypothetical protein EJK52_0023 [Moraxella catarrhalis]
MPAVLHDRTGRLEIIIIAKTHPVKLHDRTGRLEKKFGKTFKLSVFTTAQVA